MRKRVVYIFILFSLLKLSASFGQDFQIQVGGYLDTYYAYDFSQPINNERLFVTQYDRHNEFNLNHAFISAQGESDKVRSNLAIQIGTYAARNYSAEPEKLYQLIHNAYVGYKIGTKGWLDMGVFGGHFGYESALGLERDLYSPALATEYTPYYQSGLRYTYAISERTEMRAVVLNGWQNIGENNQFKSFGLAIDHSFSKAFFLSYGNYFGKDPIGLSEAQWRIHNNVVVKASLSDKFIVTGIFDYTLQNLPNQEERIHAMFLTFIAKYALSEDWSFSGRYEFVNDDDELLITSPRAPAFSMNIGSLCIARTLQENAAFKAEVKLYSGSKKSFQGEEGEGSGAIVFSGGMMIRIQ